MTASAQSRAALDAAEAAMACDPIALLTGGAEPEPFRHYPDGDVYDLVTHCQFYCHVHRAGEYGHIHLFLRPLGMPRGVRPAFPTAEADAPAHLVAVGFGPDRRATELFTTNRWVTGEAWYAAADVKAMLPWFRVQGEGPAGVVARWLTALVAVHRPLIASLIDQRDEAVAAWNLAHPDGNPLDDLGLEILSRAAL